MSIASAIATKQQQVADAYTAVSAKGGTLPATQNLTNLATAIGTISGGSTPTLITKSITANGTYNASSDNADGYSSVTVNVSGGSSGKYTLYQRVKDDTNTEIGTVVGFLKDSNNVEYAVVCLDSSTWGTSTKMLSSNVEITTLTKYDSSLWYFWNSNETATQNCDNIITFCNQSGETSPAVELCRNLSYTIDNVTYYGQVPNMKEVFMLCSAHSEVYAKDPTQTSTGSRNFASPRNIRSSVQYSASQTWCVNSSYTHVTAGNKTLTGYYVIPILEIPNA